MKEHDPARREVLAAGGLLVGALALGGCQGGGARSGLPDPPWPGAPSAGAGANGHLQPPLPPTTNPPVGPRGPVAPVQAAGVVPRSQWTRMGVARPNDIFPMGVVTRITIHHDGMDAFMDTSMNGAARRLESIRQSHVVSRGWADIAYHYIIDPAGRVWEGRSVRYQGAHVKEQNEHNLGVMCMGNFEISQPTAATKSALDRFVASQMRTYGVPMARVYTHQELGKTECPGRNMQRYVVASRKWGGGMTVAGVEEGAGHQALGTGREEGRLG